LCLYGYGQFHFYAACENIDTKNKGHIPEEKALSLTRMKPLDRLFSLVAKEIPF